VKEQAVGLKSRKLKAEIAALGGSSSCQFKFESRSSRQAAKIAKVDCVIPSCWYLTPITTDEKG